MKRPLEDTESPTLTSLLTRDREPIAADRGSYVRAPLFSVGIALAPRPTFETGDAPHQPRARRHSRTFSRG